MTRPMNIVILTGSGISAESGIPTFRTSGATTFWDYIDSGGVRRSHPVEEVCTPEAFARDPALVQHFYDQRRAALAAAEPNAAHHALARLDSAWTGELLIVTQNVDDLHERAGATRLLHMHGALRSAWCLACDGRSAWDGPLEQEPSCPACGVAGVLRPDIVWFGEIPYGMERIDRALERADLFVSIGTSGAVYPAAGFVRTARYHGAATLELNLEPSGGSIFFDETRLGPAGQLVPEWVDALLG
ncbi:MAG: NAD-dependent protein deacylase [Sphingomonas bacterium]|nr:NAD-dependent protein deacylase [Sphingomonas bacterium]